MYCCIDLKSFFASVECVDRGLDPFTTNLVVADPARNSGTVCLAITPAMKALGIKNRCRVFEIPKNIEYIMAKPRMKLYMEKSAEIFSIYLRFVSPDDMHVYSVDECFIDLKDYEKLYKKSAEQIAKEMIDEVYKQTGICATVGLGTNLFLAKIALDITAKHSPDFFGFLDEEKFKKTIWHHKPITDIWNVGGGIAKRLSKYGITDLYGVAHCPESLLYKEFGINAELLIDHANGIEPCTIKDIHEYRSKTNSISNGQILFTNYNREDALKVLKEMVEGEVYEIVEKDLVAGSISLTINYADKTIKGTGGTKKLLSFTSSEKTIMENFISLFNETVLKNQPIRKISIGLNNIVPTSYIVYDLFSDREKLSKENKLIKAVVGIKNKYGKNALLKGVSYEKGATARDRNRMIGGHNSGEDD